MANTGRCSRAWAMFNSLFERASVLPPVPGSELSPHTQLSCGVGLRHNSLEFDSGRSAESADKSRTTVYVVACFPFRPVSSAGRARLLGHDFLVCLVVAKIRLRYARSVSLGFYRITGDLSGPASIERYRPCDAFLKPHAKPCRRVDSGAALSPLDLDHAVLEPPAAIRRLSNPIRESRTT